MSFKPIQINTFYKGYISKPEILKISGGTVIAIMAIALAILAHYDISGANVSIFKGIGAMGQTGILLLIGSGSFLLSICLASLFKKIKILESMKSFNDKEKILKYFAALEKKGAPRTCAIVSKDSTINPDTDKYMILSEQLNDTHVLYTVLQSTKTDRTVTFFYALSSLPQPIKETDESFTKRLEENERRYSQVNRHTKELDEKGYDQLGVSDVVYYVS